MAFVPDLCFLPMISKVRYPTTEWDSVGLGWWEESRIGWCSVHAHIDFGSG